MIMKNAQKKNATHAMLQQSEKAQQSLGLTIN